MPELLIKIGENFPHKDLMLSLKTTDSSAYDEWIDREASKISAKRDLKLDDAVVEAEAQWARKIRGCVRQGDIIQVRPDGTPYGKRESSPRFYRARISLSELEKLKIKNPKDLRQPCWEIAPWEDEEGEGIYYHKFGWRLTAEAFGLLEDGSIVEIRASDLVQKDRYEEYDPDKALEHNSAGTFEIKPSGGDYTDLSTWEAGEQCDLTTDGGQGLCIAECYKGDYSGSGGGTNYISDHLDIDGWTTDENNYVKIYTLESERHNGKAKEDGDYTGFTVKGDQQYDYVIDGEEAYTEINGILIDCSNKSAIHGIYNVEMGGVVANSIVFDVDSNNPGIEARIIYNCLVYNHSDGPGMMGAPYASNECYNCTAVGCEVGFKRSDGSAADELYNCLAYNNDTDFSGYDSGEINYCASSDGTADDFGGSNNIVNISDPFNDYANDDFSLASDSTDVSGEGIGPDSDSDVPDEDIIGTSRSGSTCDIGAFEYVAEGGDDQILTGVSSAASAPAASGSINTGSALSGSTAVAPSPSVAGEAALGRALEGTASIASAPATSGTLASGGAQILEGTAAVSASPAIDGQTTLGHAFTGAASTSEAVASPGTLTVGDSVPQALTGTSAISEAQAVAGVLIVGTLLTGTSAIAEASAVAGDIITGIEARAPPAKAEASAVAGGLTTGHVIIGIPAISDAVAVSGTLLLLSPMERPVIRVKLRRVTPKLAVDRVTPLAQDLKPMTPRRSVRRIKPPFKAVKRLTTWV